MKRSLRHQVIAPRLSPMRIRHRRQRPLLELFGIIVTVAVAVAIAIAVGGRL